jgi:hypothetical protein
LRFQKSKKSFKQFIWNKTALLIRVLPTFSWEEAQTAAMEEDCGFVVFDVYEAASSSLDGHYFAIQALGDPVGDWM